MCCIPSASASEAAERPPDGRMNPTSVLGPFPDRNDSQSDFGLRRSGRRWRVIAIRVIIISSGVSKSGGFSTSVQYDLVIVTPHHVQYNLVIVTPPAVILA